jgi:YggT family protein
MIALRDTLLLILNIAYFIVIVHFIMSWLVNFQVLNLRQPLVAQIWDGLNRLLEPVYSRIRRFLPNLGGIDLSPIVVIIVIFFLQRLVATQIW